jgi:hypothetical protein
MSTGLRPSLSDKAPHHQLGRQPEISKLTHGYMDLHAGDGLRQREGRNEQASIERGIALVADVEM